MELTEKINILMQKEEAQELILTVRVYMKDYIWKKKDISRRKILSIKKENKMNLKSAHSNQIRINHQMKEVKTPSSKINQLDLLSNSLKISMILLRNKRKESKISKRKRRNHLKVTSSQKSFLS